MLNVLRNAYKFLPRGLGKVLTKQQMEGKVDNILYQQHSDNSASSNILSFFLDHPDGFICSDHDV